MKTWLKQVVDSFKVGENFARFAMVHYNKERFDNNFWLLHSNI